MKIRLRLRPECWIPASPKKMTSWPPLSAALAHLHDVHNERSSRTKTILLSTDLLPFLALLLLFCGCEKSPPPQLSPSSSEQEHTHSESEPHHSHEEEHGILPHKPRTFADAVVQIDQRGHELLNHRHGHHITEWFDILGWLPEIAADTDLKKVDWDSVVRIGRDLETWSSGWKVGDKNQPDPARLDILVAELKAIVTKLPVRG